MFRIRQQQNNISIGQKYTVYFFTQPKKGSVHPRKRYIYSRQKRVPTSVQNICENKRQFGVNKATSAKMIHLRVTTYPVGSIQFGVGLLQQGRPELVGLRGLQVDQLSVPQHNKHPLEQVYQAEMGHACATRNFVPLAQAYLPLETGLWGNFVYTHRVFIPAEFKP